MLTPQEITAALNARELAVASRDTEVVDPPASPVGLPTGALHPESIDVGLLDAGTAVAVLDRLLKDARLNLADWLRAADAAQHRPRTQITLMAGVGRQTVYRILEA